jgi:hypothetical protein
MKIACVFPLLLAGICLANRAHAATWYEVGDAGDQISTAQNVFSATPNTPLTQIVGTLTVAYNVSEVDIYRIYISSPNIFSASMIFGEGLFNAFDSQLMVFNSNGVGLADDDDAANGSPQANVPAGSLAGSLPGIYYLLVDGSGEYPVDKTGHLLFPNYNDGTTDPTKVAGPQSALPLAGYTGFSGEGGLYAISFTGAQFTNNVPEPSGGVLLGAGALALACWQTRRRSSQPVSPPRPI